MTRPHAIIAGWIVVWAFATTLCGCGGGGGTATTTSALTGGLLFEVVWPTASESSTGKRLIPQATSTIRVELTDPTSSAVVGAAVTITRSSVPVERVLIQGIRPGPVRVAAKAFSATDTTNPLATGSVDTTVVGGENTTVNIELFPVPPVLPPLSGG